MHWTESDARTSSPPESVGTCRRVAPWSGCSRCWAAACESVFCVRHHLGICELVRTPFKGVWRTHQFLWGCNRTSPSKTSKPFLCSAHQSPATISLASRCCCETLRGNHVANRPRLPPSSEPGPTWGTHRGKTAQRSGTLRLPLSAFRLSWTLESDWLLCRDFALLFSAVVLSCRLAVCCWTGTKRNGKQKRRVECAFYALPLQFYDVLRARLGPWAVRLRGRVKGMLGVEAACCALSQHFAMDGLVMRGRDFDWNQGEKALMIAGEL